MAGGSGANDPQPEQPKSPGPDEKRPIGNANTDKQEQLPGKSEDARAEADLFQQRRMAAAAEDQARTTWLQYERSIFEIWVNAGAAIAGALAAVFAGVAALVSWLGIKDARRHAGRELRAYIHVDSVVVEDFSADRPYKVNVTIKNFGQTPAYNVRFAIGTVILGEIYHFVNLHSEASGLPLKRGSGPNIGTLGPTQDFSMPIGRGDGPPKTYRQFIVIGDMQAFVYGRIEYSDAFGERHVTWFQHRTVSIKNIDPAGPGKRTVVCAEGNTTDDYEHLKSEPRKQNGPLRRTRRSFGLWIAGLPPQP